MSEAPPTIRHLPKRLDEVSVRQGRHETRWKEVAIDLLARRETGLSGWTLLDYGCGRGEMMELASGHGMRTTGTDLDPECVGLGRRFGPTELLEHPDRPLEQFEPGSFDVVTCLHVLEHVPRPRDVLADLGRIARKFVIVAVPNPRSLPRLRHLRHEPWEVNEGHLQTWDHPHFRNLAERHCGLEIVDWGFDHCKVPVVGEVVRKLVGERMLYRLETGLFLRFFPFHSASVIALLKPCGRRNPETPKT